MKPFSPFVKDIGDAIVQSEGERTFYYWMTVEAKDKQGEILSVEGLYKDVEDWINLYGGVMHLGHTNKNCGKALKCERLPYDGPRTEYHGLDAVRVLAKIYKSPREGKALFFDYVWNLVKTGKIGMVSLGGEGARATKICHDDKCDIFTTILEETDVIYETALVPKGANPAADIVAVNDAAKSDWDRVSNLIMGCQECDEQITKMVKEDGMTLSKAIVKFISTEDKTMPTKEEKKEFPPAKKPEDEKKPEDKKPEDGKKPAPEGQEPKPNPDAAAPPHSEPDADNKGKPGDAQTPPEGPAGDKPAPPQGAPPQAPGAPQAPQAPAAAPDDEGMKKLRALIQEELALYFKQNGATAAQPQPSQVRAEDMAKAAIEKKEAAIRKDEREKLEKELVAKGVLKEAATPAPGDSQQTPDLTKENTKSADEMTVFAKEFEEGKTSSCIRKIAKAKNLKQ